MIGEQPLSDSYLKAIGRVIVNWSQLEGLLDLLLIKLLGMAETDPRAHIVFAEMPVQAKIDVLITMANLLAVLPSNSEAHERFKKHIYPRLGDLKAKRNAIAHSKWGVTGTRVMQMRPKAKGQFTVKQTIISLREIERTADDIVKLASDIYAMVQRDEPREPGST